jgi:hypothetical protein
MATAPWPAAQTPTNRGGYAAPASETINTDDFYLNMEQIPPAGPTAQSGSEWTPPERPIIRPQTTSAPMQRRASGQVPAQRPADELGVEESEFDKPTYLRRGLYAPE